MIKIFADTHKIIASKIHENILNVYNIDLNKEKLLWGSVAPDMLPKYKFHRHYFKESLNFVVNEIVTLIYISRYLELNSRLDPLTNKLFSRKLGIISHYLCDFVCLPHAERWTFSDSMIKHLNYEYKLNEYALNHDFNRNIIKTDDIEIFGNKIVKLKSLIRSYIENVVDEYSSSPNFKTDLDFGLSLSLRVSYFIIDTVKSYSLESNRKLSFVF